MAVVRSIGSGTVAFGLVSVPVKIYTATSEAREGFNLLHSCGEGRLARVTQQLKCAACETVVDRGSLLKGREVAKDSYVAFTDAEIKDLEAGASPVIDIREFVPLTAVDPIYFDGSQYLGPDKGADRAYRLLANALKNGNVIAIAQQTFRGKERIVAIRERAGGLVLHVLHYADEVRSQEPILDDVTAAESADEASLAAQLVKQLTTDTFNPAAYRDTYRERVEAAVQAKARGESVPVSPTATKGAPIDLFAALKASVERTERATTKPAAAVPVPEAKKAKAKGGRKA